MKLFRASEKLQTSREEGLHPVSRIWFSCTTANVCEVAGRARSVWRPDENLVRDMGHSNTAMTEHYRQKTKAGIVEQLQNLVFFSGVSRESGKVS
jgi:hypothetical protein